MSNYVLSNFTEDHLDQAVPLSKAEHWPHRREDWEMLLGLSTGLVATDGTAVVGTTLRTDYGPDVAMMNMIIVREAERGQGLARKLMQAVMDEAPSREFRLVATPLGLPLYQKLGFEPDGEIVQLQGEVTSVDAPAGGIFPVTADEVKDVTQLDRRLLLADRRGLLEWLAAHGQLAATRDSSGQMTGYAACRVFGRGHVIGPIVAETVAQAQDLIRHFAHDLKGSFLRIDTDPALGLVPWLEGIGLAAAGDGVKMRKNAKTQPCAAFGLCSQALG